MGWPGADCSFELYIIRDDFAGKNALKRQRPVLALLKADLTTGPLHALSMKARIPVEHSSQGAWWTAIGLAALRMAGVVVKRDEVSDFLRQSNP